MGTVALRSIEAGDPDRFFEFERDPASVRMAAFTSPDQQDRAKFDRHWARILGDDTVTVRTITFDGEIAGSVLSYEIEGDTEVAYWIDRALWGRGIATAALTQFLAVVTERPLHARAARDNRGSAAVLRRCGFVVTGENRDFAPGRGEVLTEDLYLLR